MTVDAAGPQVRDDMTVELALSVMAGAGSGRLFLCDEDDQCTGLITRERLIAVRDSPAYTDQLRLRDVLALTR
jgi:predicted transcriptional regulator